MTLAAEIASMISAAHSAAGVTLRGAIQQGIARRDAQAHGEREKHQVDA
jgi:hypothetical protein